MTEPNRTFETIWNAYRLLYHRPAYGVKYWDEFMRIKSCLDKFSRSPQNIQDLTGQNLRRFSKIQSTMKLRLDPQRFIDLLAETVEKELQIK